MEVFNGKEFGSFILNIPDLSYEQFTSSIVLAIPDSEIAQRFVDLTNSCMYIEFVTIAADIIYTHKHNVSDKTINELAFIVADAAQEYFAAASELGILKPRSEKPFTIQTSFDKVFIEEQKHLADLGLDDYATNLLG